MRLVKYISRHPIQKAKKVTAYDEGFIVAKLKLTFESNTSLDSNKTHPASHLHQLLKTHDPALQITPKIEANNRR